MTDKSLPGFGLAAIVDAVADARFHGIEIPYEERRAAAQAIAARQGLPNSYRGGFFAPLPDEDIKTLYVYSGDHISSRAGALHILGEECCTALATLGVMDADIVSARERALVNLHTWLDHPKRRHGTFCCGTCSVAFWRNILSGPTPFDADAELAGGMAFLKSRRTEDGKWRGMPFVYTVLALIDMDRPDAKAELKYASPALERLLKSKSSARYAERRREIAKKGLSLT